MWVFLINFVCFDRLWGIVHAMLSAWGVFFSLLAVTVSGGELYEQGRTAEGRPGRTHPFQVTGVAAIERGPQLACQFPSPIRKLFSWKLLGVCLRRAR